MRNKEFREGSDSLFCRVLELHRTIVWKMHNILNNVWKSFHNDFNICKNKKVKGNAFLIKKKNCIEGEP